MEARIVVDVRSTVGTTVASTLTDTTGAMDATDATPFERTLFGDFFADVDANARLATIERVGLAQLCDPFGPRQAHLTSATAVV